jgi:choline dehydrogenase
MKLVRRIVGEKPLADVIASEHLPGAEFVTDDDLLGIARRISQTIYHPVGTAKMGRDPAAVVDDRLRVNGVPGLRVVDASVMPNLTSGNTNAPTTMIAEKASDLIRADAKAA